jgi:hypothetical protein
MEPTFTFGMAHMEPYYPEVDGQRKETTMQAVSSNHEQSRNPIFEFPELNPERRLRQLILYITAQCYDEPTFGMTVLNKLLLFADIAAFVSRGTSVSGSAYVKQPHGPVPDGIKTIIDSMIADGDLVPFEIERFGHTQKRLCPVGTPDLGMFNGYEMGAIGTSIATFCKVNATDISKMSHGRAWECANMGERIPYQAFLLSSEPMTDEDEIWATEMQAKFGDAWPE